MEKDLVVIGGGPGGYVAAIRAAQLGAKVCLIEKDSMGGTCLNRGCIPTKTLYRNAEILNTLNNIEEFGINLKGYEIDVTAIQNRKQKVVNQLVTGIEKLLKGNKVEIIKGEASIKDKNTVKVVLEDSSEVEISAKNIIIATGSRPFLPPIEGIKSEGIYTSEGILGFDSVPESLTVIGGGVIGIEFAGIFKALGSEVTVVEFLPSILAQVDSDLTKRLTASLKKKGINIHTSTKVDSIKKEDGKFLVNCTGKKGELSVTSTAVLVSTGRLANVDEEAFNRVGIQFNRKGIVVNENMETSVEGIYAIGDVNGISMLAHAASHQGLIAVESIFGRSVNKSHTIPGCIFTFPEIACAGITEDEAKAKGIEYKTSKFLFGANGKALSLGEPEGMVKVIADKEDNKIIGVHIMGPHASDLVHEGILAIEKGMTADDIAPVIHAHPTLAEAFHEAILGLTGEAIHSVPTGR